jgi:hypothetical protein
MFKGKLKIRLFSLFTCLVFIGSTFGAYAQDIPPMISPQSTSSSLPSSLLSASPELQMLGSNLNSIESALRQIEDVATPIYNKIAPSNMEAMSVAERVKAIVGNTKTAVQGGVQSYKGQVNDWNQAHGITPNTSFEEELGVGLKQLGVETSKMPLGGSGNALVDKLKTIISSIKDKLQSIIAMIKAKITALAQKIGLMKKDSAADDSAKEPKKDAEGEMAQAPNADVQYSDTFSGKLQKGVTEGAKSAKASLKNSFSFTNLAITTGVAVGTNLAIQIVKGEKPSFGKAAKAVASVEFAGSVVGGALGAAGGQFLGTLTKTFMPGPIGSLVGAFVPVLTGSLGAQMGSAIAGDAKQGRFSLVNAWKQVDKVDLLGSSIGSTIGMALGAPIPIIGPIIGGIVGGVIGSKVAKWIQGMFKGTVTLRGILQPGSNLPSNIPQGGEVSIGNFSQPSANPNPDIPRGVTGVSSEISVSPDVKAAEQKYYETYLQYNRLVEQGKYDEAKTVYTDLKAYSDQYNALKNQNK